MSSSVAQPLRSPQLAQQPPSQGTPALHAARRLRVAIAEDDADLRSTLARALSEVGYVVDAFASGNQLVEHLATALVTHDVAEIPDVIITDIRMPGFNGLRVAESLRHGGWSVPIIVVSAVADRQVRDRVKRLGASAFFDKPFSPDDLELCLTELILQAQ